MDEQQQMKAPITARMPGLETEEDYLQQLFMEFEGVHRGTAPPGPTGHPMEDLPRDLVEEEADAADDGRALKRRRDASGEEGGDSGDDDEQTGAGKRKGGKQSTAAQKKASREKLRRERINERFTQLARLIDPGEVPKTDKLSILGDAIKLINHMRQQNYQLRELNKYLQERAAKSESHNSYQMLLSAAGHGLVLPGVLSGAGIAGPSPSDSGAGPSQQVTVSMPPLQAVSGLPPVHAVVSSAQSDAQCVPIQQAATTQGQSASGVPLPWSISHDDPMLRPPAA